MGIIINDTYTNRTFNSSVDEIRSLHSAGFSNSEIAERVNLSDNLVSALVERFVMKWDNYSNLPSVSAYEEN